MNRILARVLAAMCLVGVAAVTLAMAQALPGPSDSADGEALSAVDRFLDRYLADDGRVVRHDQDGDTVSEGQAYAMLAAVAAGDRSRFDLAWGWTRSNIQRADGLLAWRWHDGAIVDRESATDADLDAAYALLLAGDRFGPAGYTEEGLRIAKAILAHETVAFGNGEIVTAGTWTQRMINASYFSPRIFDELARRSGDSRWSSIRRSSAQFVDTLTQGGRLLPADWARIGPGGGVLTGSSDDEGAWFGLDAQRLPVRLADSCDVQSTRRAAAWWPFLQTESQRGPVRLRYDLSGRPLSEFSHPLGLVAAAASARAWGGIDQRDELLSRAESLEKQFPTYYGAAWVALGRLMLTTERLGGCPDPGTQSPPR